MEDTKKRKAAPNKKAKGKSGGIWLQIFLLSQVLTFAFSCKMAEERQSPGEGQELSA